MCDSAISSDVRKFVLILSRFWRFPGQSFEIGPVEGFSPSYTRHHQKQAAERRYPPIDGICGPSRFHIAACSYPIRREPTAPPAVLGAWSLSLDPRRSRAWSCARAWWRRRCRRRSSPRLLRPSQRHRHWLPRRRRATSPRRRGRGLAASNLRRCCQRPRTTVCVWPYRRPCASGCRRGCGASMSRRPTRRRWRSRSSAILWGDRSS